MGIEIGVIISETEPNLPLGTYLWGKPTSNTVEWYEVKNGVPVLVTSEPFIVFAAIDHSHATHGDINFTGSVSVGGSAGLTGSRLIPTVGTLTFTKGILTGFTPV